MEDAPVSNYVPVGTTKLYQCQICPEQRYGNDGVLPDCSNGHSRIAPMKPVETATSDSTKK
jgi:hypothetical protein